MWPRNSAGGDSTGAPRLEWLFRISAAGAVVAVLVHVAAMVSPAAARLEYPQAYPAWRHVVFIAIDSTLAVLFLVRPIWLIPLFAVLTVQILNGHGRFAWHLWIEERRVDWISIAISIAAPIALVLLIAERWPRRRTAQPTARVDLASDREK